jgi:threonine dehydrogenase-like Zn-dependent dehydrogenase
LSDILPTGYQAVFNAKIGQGSTVAIFGAGPVGLMAAACARMLGAERIYMIDDQKYRLDFAVSAYDIIPVDFSSADPSEFILANTAGRGVDASIDAVGFEAKGSTTETVLSTLKLETSSGEVLRQCITATRRGGIISVPGVYAGFIHAFLIGDAFDKGLTLAMGQTHVQRYLPELLDFIEEGSLAPDIIISHRMKLADAARGYEVFDKKEEDCRKVVLTP